LFPFLENFKVYGSKIIFVKIVWVVGKFNNPPVKKGKKLTTLLQPLSNPLWNSEKTLRRKTAKNK
jgi:hypothetical protein